MPRPSQPLPPACAEPLAFASGLLVRGDAENALLAASSRPWFAGADGALYDPDMAAPGMPGRCRPVAVDGPVVEAERRRLDAAFAMRLAAACAWPASGDAGRTTA